MAKRFEVYEAALGLVAGLRPVHEALRKHDRDLAEQMRRAASSVVLNLAEGNRRAGQDRLHFFRIAAGSAAEVRAALDLARAWGAIGTEPAAEAELDRVLAMLWRLTHPRPKQWPRPGPDAESGSVARGRGPTPTPRPMLKAGTGKGTETGTGSAPTPAAS